MPQPEAYPLAPPRAAHATSAWAEGLWLLVSIGLIWALYALSLSALQATKLAVLALPAWLLLGRWQPRAATGLWLRRAVLALWVAAFVADAVVRAYLWQAYGSAPDSAKMLMAVANTAAEETAEYLQHAKVRLLGWGLFGLVVWAVLLWAAPRALAAGARWGRWSGGLRAPTWEQARRLLGALLVLLVLAAYASKPWRRLHPVLWWPAWSVVVADTRATWHDWELQRDAWLSAGQSSGVTIAPDAPRTVMLVITDSVNRDNLSLYGYGRPTTPLLDQQKSQLSIMRNAWSVAANTLMTIPSMLRLQASRTPTALAVNAQPPAAQDVLALARAAGYEVHWISNHDDLAIQQRHGALAQEQAYPNHTPGRASKSLDEVVLPYVEQALARGAKHKLVVVHLLGAHPHYSARFPESFEKFGDNDAVAQQMREQGRWPWIRHLRHDYDTSLRYHDQVLSRLLTLTQAQASKGPATWIMVSDHGQEVGHQRNHTGHSPSTPAGYRIPLVVWRDRGLWPEAITQQPVRGDWLGMTLVSLLGLEWSGYDPSRDVTHPLYQWQPPALATAVPDFRH